MKNLAIFILLLSFYGNLKAEHEFGFGAGVQHTNDRTYNIKFRPSINAYYRYGKERHSLWLNYNHSFANTTQTLKFGGWDNPNSYYKTVTLNTQIVSAGIGYSYNLLHRHKSKIAVGSNIGIAVLSDDYDVTSPRARLGFFALYSFNKICIKNLSANFRLQHSFLSRSGGISDADYAFRTITHLSDASIQLAYRFNVAD